MSELKGNGGELRVVIQITRNATGKTETVELVSHTTPEQHEQIKDILGVNDGSNALNSK